MTSIRIEHVTKAFGPVLALDRVDLSVRPGELFFLLGASGGGKTTLLRCLAGFQVPDAGRILLGEEEVTAAPPHRRNLGLMFQSYALWPHMTVEQNVAFGLEERRVPRAEIRQRVGEALESVHMTGFGDRRPGELSGGQQQRVALARALVIRPRCLLLDEPLSNLDAQLRRDLGTEIRRICREFSLTTIHVTHDQKEALATADRIAILDRGRVLQVGAPRELYARPCCRQVAGLVGPIDLVPGSLVGITGERAVVETELGRFEGVLGDRMERPAVGTRVTMSVRPECWKLSEGAPPQNAVKGRIANAVFLGELIRCEFVAAGTTLTVLQMNARGGQLRGDVYASAAPEDVVVLTE